MIVRLFFAVGLFFFGVADKVSHEDELRHHLLTNYNKVALPDSQTMVQVRFSLLQFLMNEKLQSLDMDLWISMEWKDPRLSWNSSKYPGITRLAMNADSVWIPDLTLYNSANAKNVDIFNPTQVLAMPDGTVLWVPPCHVKAACVMDMTYWPYDNHNCTAKFGSWVHSKETIDFKAKDDVVNMEILGGKKSPNNLTRSEWEVVDSNVIREEKYYSCCPEAYVSVSANLVVKRVGHFYSWTVQMPLIVLSLMTVVVFLLPPCAGEKVLLGIVTLAIDFFFLYAVSNIIGNSSTHTPIIVELISKQLILTGVSVIVSGLILRLVRDPHAGGLPSCAKFPVMLLSTCLCLSGYRQMVATASLPITRTMKGEDLELNENGGTRGLFQQETGSGGENDWVLLAAVLDRLCLVVFTAIFLINMITYSGIL